ncbi:DUF4245 domain-containing protein [Actinomadura craniellae]|uniref:DUF4245 domain-containing protein n=1 Tax=Actinomadura craniellae TaxID=2231787 RepID=A0A365H5S5_9ACTN|nr:DUF4245 domain-containing protein [Actinomadura craniellae]RAY14388.1 DUF4245 domain-containing protein [Actinomadura craniellae]
MTERTAGGPIRVSPAVHKRLTTGLGGYIMAMAACFLLVGVIVAITPRSDKEVLPTVDYQTGLWAMRLDAPYTVHAPEGLPAGWRATSSRVTGLNGKGPAAWHLGMLTAADEYVAVEQSNERPADFVRRMTNTKEPVGSQQVAGVTWEQWYREDKNQRSLVRRLPGVTLVVTGTASFADLGVLAAALRPQPRNSPAPVPTPQS